jgi:hypothetical protein
MLITLFFKVLTLEILLTKNTEMTVVAKNMILVTFYHDFIHRFNDQYQ